MKAFRSRGVLVFANSKTDWSLMPAGAQKATRLTDSNYIPKVLVTTADGATEIAAISYEELREDARDAARDLADKLETVENILGSGSETSVAPTEPEPTSEPSETSPSVSGKPLSYPRDWTNAAGKTINAGINRIEGDNVIFEMGGKEVPYPIANLSRESQEEIAKLGQ